MKTAYIGLDVHSKKTVFAMQAEDGTIVAEGSVDTDREGFRAMVKTHDLKPDTPVCLESGGQAAMVYDSLIELGLRPRVVDAGEVRRKARRRGQKTDRRDAFEICDGLRRQVWDTTVYIPPAPILRLRRILSRRRHFVKLSTQQINAAKFLLRAEGLLRGKRVSLTTASGWKKLTEQEEVIPIAEHLRLHAHTWKLVQEHIGILEEELKDALAVVSEEIDLLRSIPGVGLVTASSFVASVGTPERFATSNQVVSYLGLAPSMYDSGETERHGRITKAGCSYMRSLLCEVAQQASRPTHPLNPYFARVIVKGGYKKAAIAVAQRLARIMYRVWLNREAFDPRCLNIERSEGTRAKPCIWRIKPAA